jgi:hypothetical protein|tara:strand:- start:174 stop:377 length:204 start_codon:yes stop_codon:yes gene_type:complete
MAEVKHMGAPAGSAPKAANYADIKGQGKVPYGKIVSRAGPSTGIGKMTTGKKRGMGAAQRGSRFKIC